ncbi:MAG: glycerol-3-phosphate dehydrogenase [Rhizobiales bacterium]|nr:glycerol-3-phosphate dehydrogenase [Hyphomicrobiales bacterium]
MHDIFIIGGGINGCGIARDAAGRGLSVYLAEKADLASGTSSSSTKLIHGGLRYLEQYEFNLVRESLKERETLLRMAPHIISPMRFVLPHHEGLRPKWLIRLGLFLYDHLGGRKLLPKSRNVRLENSPLGAPLKPQFTSGFEYSDCWVDDARLVVLNAMDASDHGATIRTRTEVISAHRDDQGWSVTVRDLVTGRREEISAKVLINAAGPWVSEVASSRLKLNGHSQSRLVKGSHIVVRQIFEHDRAYIFQNPDGRIIFAIPYEDDFTLIGTTDVDVGADPNAAHISEEEITYLLDAAGEYFAKPIRRSDVVWSYSGIRPLFDDGEQTAQEITRDYVLSIDAPKNQAPLLNIFGGKITTYRHLAEEALTKLADWLPTASAAWTSGAALPGGKIATSEVGDLAGKIRNAHPSLSPDQAIRYARTYGTAALDWPESDPGEEFGAGLSANEVRYLIAREWARTAEDVLWRRTKLGLRLEPEQVARLDAWMQQNQPDAIHQEG